jgi:hypothetical protein
VDDDGWNHAEQRADIVAKEPTIGELTNPATSLRIVPRDRLPLRSVAGLSGFPRKARALLAAMRS